MTGSATKAALRISIAGRRSSRGDTFVLVGGEGEREGRGEGVRERKRRLD